MKLSSPPVMNHTLTAGLRHGVGWQGYQTAPKISISLRLDSERNQGRAEHETTVPKGRELAKDRPHFLHSYKSSNSGVSKQAQGKT